MDLKERFLKYVSYDTQSSEESTTFPSTEKQKVLLAALRDEMEALGMTEVSMDQYGYVMGTVPATPGCENAPVIGFIAHVDTSPDMSGKDVKPHVIEEYDGCDIALNGQLTMTLTSYIPSLEQVVYRVGDSALTSLYSTIHGTIVLPGGMMTRANFGGLLTDEAVCYLSNGTKLRQGRLNLPASEACSPRALLTAVLATEGFPARLTEDDVLGVAIADDTVLVNFSAHMADAIRASKLNQRMMAYQLTGALVQRYPVRRVRFFFDGEAKNTLDGDVMWAGEFLMDYVLCE